MVDDPVRAEIVAEPGQEFGAADATAGSRTTSPAQIAPSTTGVFLFMFFRYRFAQYQKLESAVSRWGSVSESPVRAS